ncbi:MAG: biopolymer transporter ExbD [Terrimicrobiaceae bacterium]|nr:biopolymer transporter ExbD [Terrimicrobiaceae bacterium]
MRRYSDRSNLTALAELNVTPLLDLAFVLLIIFMITTPLIENSMDLVVPTSSTAKSEVKPGEVQIVSIDRNGTLKLNEVEITAEALEQRLADLKREKPDLAVAVRPHNELPVQKFIAVMDILRRVGVAKLGIMTRPPDAQTAKSAGPKSGS